MGIFLRTVISLCIGLVLVLAVSVGAFANVSVSGTSGALPRIPVLQDAGDDQNDKDAACAQYQQNGAACEVYEGEAEDEAEDEADSECDQEDAAEDQYSNTGAAQDNYEGDDEGDIKSACLDDDDVPDDEDNDGKGGAGKGLLSRLGRR